MRPLPYPDAVTAQCPTRDVLDRISSKWVSLVLIALTERPLGYRELWRRIDGVSQKMLTQTLRELERDGMLSFTRVETVPPRSSYQLTGLGQSLLPVLAAVKTWAESRMPDVLAARHDFDQRTTTCAS